MSIKKSVNHELELLRENVDPPPDPSLLIEPLVALGQKLHANVLFTNFGHKLLQILLLGFTSTPNSPTLAGWKHLATTLDIEIQLIKSIENYRSQEVPTYWLLYAFANKGCDATLNKLIKGLNEIKRFDIIQQIYKPFIELSININEENQNGNILISKENGVISSKYLHDDVSIIFKNLEINNKLNHLKEIKEIKLMHIQSDWPKFEIKNVQASAKLQKRKYAKKVMLTFFTDGINEAERLTHILRDNGPEKIGVVILNEHTSSVNSDPSQCINNWFHQVDYVIPIITKGYLNSLENNDLTTDSSYLDTKYTKYISELMFANYIQSSCINYKIRCLIPENSKDLLQSHPKMSEPLFSVWISSKEIELFPKFVLKGF